MLASTGSVRVHAHGRFHTYQDKGDEAHNNHNTQRGYKHPQPQTHKRQMTYENEPVATNDVEENRTTCTAWQTPREALMDTCAHQAKIQILVEATASKL